MTYITNNMRDIDKTVKDLLTPHGFVFKRSSWYRTSDSLIQIINFQKSQYANRFYMNLGIDERTGQELVYKPEYLFSVRLRVEMIVSDTLLIDALDFEKECSEINRNEKMEALILNSINFLDSINGWEELRLAMKNKKHPLHRAFITTSFIEKINGNHD